LNALARLGQEEFSFLDFDVREPENKALTLRHQIIAFRPEIISGPSRPCEAMRSEFTQPIRPG
jgi:hypothetical protein